MATTEAISVIAFAGSLRRDSFNKALLRAAREEAPEHLAIEIFDLAEVPLYNADLERAGDPDAVERLKSAIRAADGLLIATPEYNHGVAAVTKNAVDWASRPPRASALNGKPVAILGASPGMTGTARGQSQLRQAFGFTNSYCMPQPEVLVYRAHEKFDDEGRLTDEATRKHLAKFLAAFGEWIRKFR